jgi:hypothetical protein
MTENKPLTLGDLTRRYEQVATRDYVHEVENALGMEREMAEKVADFVANEIERVGGSDARLVMIVDDDEFAGMGPYCSWCWSIGGLCRHIVGRKPEAGEVSR